MTAAAAGHAAFNHLQVKLATAGTGLPSRRRQAHDLRFRIRFQPHTFALNKAGLDHMRLDDTADRRQD